MASFVYTPAKKFLMDGSLDLNTHDIRVLLVMSDTTADTDQDAENIADIGTLDEMDGANYARKALASEAVNQDDANNRAEFDADDVVWTALGNGTRQVSGAVVYRHVTNDADAVLIAHIELTDFNPGGADVTFAWNAEGIIQLT